MKNKEQVVVQESNGRWVALTLAGLAVILSMTVWFSATAILPQMVAHFGLGTSAAAWLTNGVQAGFVVGALGSALLSVADVVRLTRLMAGAAVLAALANGVILLEPGTGGLIAARFMTGLALAGVYPPAMKFIATWFQAGRGLAMGAIVGALTLGSALPHLVGALGVGFDWRLVIAVTSLASMLAAVVFLVALKEGPHAFARTTVDPRHIGAILRNRPVMLANFGYFGHMWELYAMWGWFLAYVAAAGLGLNASIMAFAVIALGAPGSVVAGVLADRFGRPRVTAVILGLSGSCALLIGVAFDGPVWLFVLIAGLWGLTVVADSAQFSALVSELSPPHLVGSALAFQMGVGFLITIGMIWITPLLAGWAGSWRWTFLILVPGPVFGAWAMLRLQRSMA